MVDAYHMHVKTAYHMHAKVNFCVSVPEFLFLFGVLFLRTFMRPGSTTSPTDRPSDRGKNTCELLHQ